MPDATSLSCESSISSFQIIDSLSEPGSIMHALPDLTAVTTSSKERDILLGIKPN